MSSCEQCGDTAPTSHYPPYGQLCDRCSFRQAEHDDSRDTFAHLSPSNFGFISEDE